MHWPAGEFNGRRPRGAGKNSSWGRVKPELEEGETVATSAGSNKITYFAGRTGLKFELLRDKTREGTLSNQVLGLTIGEYITDALQILAHQEDLSSGGGAGLHMGARGGTGPPEKEPAPLIMRAWLACGQTSGESHQKR